GEILNEGCRKIGFPQFPFYAPLPVCNGTIPDPVPDPQPQPGSGSQQNNRQVRLPQRSPDPSKEIESDDQQVKHRKGKIKQYQPPHALPAKKAKPLPACARRNTPLAFFRKMP